LAWGRGPFLVCGPLDAAGIVLVAVAPLGVVGGVGCGGVS